MLTSTGNHLLPVNASPALLSCLQGNKGVCVCVVCVRACVHECVYILGGLGEVMALMGGAVTGDQEELHGGRSR